MLRRFPSTKTWSCLLLRKEKIHPTIKFCETLRCVEEQNTKPWLFKQYSSSSNRHFKHPVNLLPKIIKKYSQTPSPVYLLKTRGKTRFSWYSIFQKICFLNVIKRPSIYRLFEDLLKQWKMYRVVQGRVAVLFQKILNKGVKESIFQISGTRKSFRKRESWFFRPITETKYGSDALLQGRQTVLGVMYIKGMKRKLS